MYRECFNFILFYCFFYIEYSKIDVLQDQLGVKRDFNLEVNKAIFIYDDRKMYQRQGLSQYAPFDLMCCQFNRK